MSSQGEREGVRWRVRLQQEMAHPYDSVRQAAVVAAWTALPAAARLLISWDLTGPEQDWLSAAGRGEDPTTLPRAESASARADGIRLQLEDGRECLVPWHISTALEAATEVERAQIEILEDGRVLHWPATGDEQRVAALVAHYVLT